MTKGSADVSGAKRTTKNTNRSSGGEVKQIATKSLMDFGRDTMRAAKSIAKEQILGKNALSPKRSGLSLVQKARDERKKKFDEAKKKFGSKKGKQSEEERSLGSGEWQVKVKEEMLNPFSKKPTMAVADMLTGRNNNTEASGMVGVENEIEAKEKAEVPNEIQMGEEDETEEEYRARIEEEEHNIEVQRQSYTDEEWADIEEKRSSEESVMDPEDRERARKPATLEVGSQSKGESSEEKSGEQDDADNQSFDSEGGNNKENEQVIELDVNSEGSAIDVDEEDEGDQNGKEENEETDDKKEETAKVSFLDAAKGKTQQYMGARITYEHTCRFEISAVVNGMPENATDDQTAAMLKDMIVSILKRFKNITKKVAIQPWYKETLLPSIEKSSGISEDLNTLRDYIVHEGSKNRKFRNGRNSRLLVNISFGKVAGGGEEIQHLWQLQTKEFNNKRLMPITLKVACMQSEAYYPIGAFVNSSEKQVTKELAKGIGKVVGANIEIAYRDVPAEYKTIETFWVKAKERAGRGNIRGSYEYAPQALVVYTDEKVGVERMKIIQELMTKYGKMTVEGKYPMMPDGSRMRYIPPETMAPTSQRHKIRDSIKRQIDLRTVTTDIDMEYAFDIDKVMETGPHKGRSLGSLVLGLSSADNKYGGVPFFKHFIHKWAMDFRYRGVSVAVFTNMAPIASEIMGSLQGIMEKTYGKEVGDEIKTFRGGATLTSEGNMNSDLFQIQLDDDDWFEKTGSFVLTGIFNENNGNEPRGHTNEKKGSQKQAPAMRLPSGAELMMDTHSIVSMFSAETDATKLLSGTRDSNQGGLPAGKANTRPTVASALAKAAQAAREEEAKLAAHGQAPQKASKKASNKAETDESKSTNKNKKTGTPKKTTTIAPSTPKDRRPHTRNSANITGRGRDGGRGNYNTRGRAKATMPMVISPQGKSTKKKAGDGGGSGPDMSTTDQVEREDQWEPIGTKEDEQKLLKEIEQQQQQTPGASGVGKQP